MFCLLYSSTGALSAEEAVENILDISRRVEQRHHTPDESELEPAAAHITEDEIEQFGRALMDGQIPPPPEQ